MSDVSTYSEMHQDRLSYGQVGDQGSPKQVFQLCCMSEDVHNGMFKGGREMQEGFIYLILF